jgi:ABC-2 type transport system ATP-binding protein
LATLLRPDEGQVCVAGLNVVGHPVAVRRTIGLAGQNAAIDSALTGRENLVMIGRLYRLSAPQARSGAEEVLERLSLVDAADRPVRTYSGGMRRRLDVGASLVGRPQVLLLDEPSTGLDPAARLELWSLLAQLVAKGATVLLTTQQLEEADRLADVVTIIDHGSVVAEGSPSELKERLGYETLEVTLADPSGLRQAVEVLRPLASDEMEVDEAAARVTFRAARGTKALASGVRLLDQADIVVEDVTARRPSLDDVFISLLGRRPEAVASARAGLA